MTDIAAPAYASIERSIVIRRSPEHIQHLVTDFTNWPKWSPWEGADADMQRTYEGTQGSVGAHYEWAGNRKAGAGSMQVTSITPGTVHIDLTFTRPFKGKNKVVYTMSPEGDAAGEGSTKLVWTMLSPKTLRSRIMGAVMNIDKMVGGDFEKGLAALRELAERE